AGLAEDDAEVAGLDGGLVRIDEHDAVAALALRLIQRLVRDLDRPREAALRAGPRERDADADGHDVRGRRARVRNPEIHDVVADLLRQRACVVVWRAVQHEHELLAAVARAEVERPLRET